MYFLCFSCPNHFKEVLADDIEEEPAAKRTKALDLSVKDSSSAELFHRLYEEASTLLQFYLNSEYRFIFNIMPQKRVLENFDVPKLDGTVSKISAGSQ